MKTSPCQPFRARAAPFLAFAAVVAVACSDDTSSSGAVAPEGPPELRIDALIPAGGPRWTPGSGTCVELGRDPDRTIDVVIGKANATGALVNWTLQPPFGCNRTPQCGFVELDVDPCDPPTGSEQAVCKKVEGTSRTIFSAGRSISVTMADPGATVWHRFHVALRNDDGTPAADLDGKRFATSEVVVEVREHCGEAIGDAGADATGADASPDAGADAGADATADAASGDSGPSSTPDASPEASPPVEGGAADADADTADARADAGAEAASSDATAD